jgi:hypothetical protein
MTNRKKMHPLRIYLIPFITIGMLLACSSTNQRGQQAEQNPDNQNTAQNNDQQNQNQDQQQNQVNEENHQNEEDPGSVQGHTDQWVSLNHGGFGFWYDPAVIEDIQPSTISQSAGGMYEVPHPPYVQYALPLDSGSISVVEIPWYEDVSEAAAEIFPELMSLINAQNAHGLDCVPELPLLSFFRQCDHQQFNANVAFVGFANGSGVRFVTVYGIQDAVPVSNTDLVYVYQGITDDGQCYVQASFRLTHQGLEEYTEFPPDVNSDTTGEALSAYFAEYEQILVDAPDGFQPGLERFDLIIQSIEVAACSGG